MKFTPVVDSWSYSGKCIKCEGMIEAGPDDIVFEEETLSIVVFPQFYYFDCPNCSKRIIVSSKDLKYNTRISARKKFFALQAEEKSLQEP